MLGQLHYAYQKKLCPTRIGRVIPELKNPSNVAPKINVLLEKRQFSNPARRGVDQRLLDFSKTSSKCKEFGATCCCEMNLTHYMVCKLTELTLTTRDSSNTLISQTTCLSINLAVDGRRVVSDEK